MKRAFTLIEILIVLAIIAILSSIVLYYSLAQNSERTYFEKSKKELNTMAAALELYSQANFGAYPPDVNRNVPPGLEDYLSTAGTYDEWPDAAWPGSVYDWDHWEDTDYVGQDIYQISIRFCPVGGPLSACRFPQQPWAANFGVNSAVYYCVSGLCRAHENEAIDYPGYCINC